MPQMLKRGSGRHVHVSIRYAVCMSSATRIYGTAGLEDERMRRRIGEDKQTELHLMDDPHCRWRCHNFGCVQTPEIGRLEGEMSGLPQSASEGYRRSTCSTEASECGLELGILGPQIRVSTPPLARRLARVRHFRGWSKHRRSSSG
jgi:hypothetical protein